MRDIADGTRLRKFLHELARLTRGPATIYLVGGSSAVWEGWRDTTVDIDITPHPEPGEFYEAVARLKDELSVNVEIVEPSQFIPELPGWRERSPLLLTIQDLTVRHYDFYSQALAKIERGHPRDIADTEAMVRRGLVEPRRLLELFAQIRPLLIRYPAVDERHLAAQVADFVQRMTAARPR